MTIFYAGKELYTSEINWVGLANQNASPHQGTMFMLVRNYIPQGLAGWVLGIQLIRNYIPLGLAGWVTLPLCIMEPMNY